MNWRKYLRTHEKVSEKRDSALLNWKTCLTCKTEIEVPRSLDGSPADEYLWGLGCSAAMATEETAPLLALQEKIHRRVRAIGGKVRYRCRCSGCLR